MDKEEDSSIKVWQETNPTELAKCKKKKNDKDLHDSERISAENFDEMLKGFSQSKKKAE